MRAGSGHKFWCVLRVSESVQVRAYKYSHISRDKSVCESSK